MKTESPLSAFGCKDDGRHGLKTRVFGLGGGAMVLSVKGLGALFAFFDIAHTGDK
jgi:hypothetical protein